MLEIFADNLRCGNVENLSLLRGSPTSERLFPEQGDEDLAVEVGNRIHVYHVRQVVAVTPEPTLIRRPIAEIQSSQTVPTGIVDQESAIDRDNRVRVQHLIEGEGPLDVEFFIQHHQLG